MSKKGIALALVLIIAMSGAFALDLNTVDDVTATLKATIGDYLDHGFINPSTPGVFEPTKTIENAFATDPVFTYGYKTNMDIVTIPIKFQMSVSDFILQSNTDIRIKIADVLVGANAPAPVNGVYTLLTSAASGLEGQAVVTIQPLKDSGTDHLGVTVASGDTDKYVNDDAVPGEYISTVTISVAAV